MSCPLPEALGELKAPPSAGQIEDWFNTRRRWWLCLGGIGIGFIVYACLGSGNSFGPLTVCCLIIGVGSAGFAVIGETVDRSRVSSAPGDCVSVLVSEMNRALLVEGHTAHKAQRVKTYLKSVSEQGRSLTWREYGLLETLVLQDREAGALSEALNG